MRHVSLAVRSPRYSDQHEHGSSAQGRRIPLQRGLSHHFAARRALPSARAAAGLGRRHSSVLPRSASVMKGRRQGFRWTTALAFALLAVPTPSAQRTPLSFRVRETSGIQRTQYPVSARIPLPKGALTDISQARLQTGGSDVPVQFTAATTWDDGSVQSLDVDFNASLEPEEERRYQVQLGGVAQPGGVANTAPPAARGLTVDEQADVIQVSVMKFSRSGAPLVA